MKSFLVFMLCGAFGLSAFAGTTRTTTTSTYEESASEPAINSDLNTDSGASSDMIETEEYDGPLSRDEVNQARWDEQQRMEEKNESVIDYSDRTRTNRARKALNTGSHASDDE